MDPVVNPSTPAPVNRASPPNDASRGGSSATTPNATPGTVVPATLFNPPTPSEEGSDLKRRRIARACDMCRKKKIKCDGKLPACTHCTNYKTQCLFTIVEKKRNPPKGAKYIEGLENRLGRMESLLKLSGLLPDGDEQTDLGDLERRLQESAGSSQKARSIIGGRSSSESTRATPNVSTPHSAANSPKFVRFGGVEEEEDVEALSDQLCSLVTTNAGETRFIGSSSGFSIFSPKGRQWVREKTGDNSFEAMITSVAQEREANCNADVLFRCRGASKNLFQSPEGIEQNVPPREIAVALVNDYFKSFNHMFPLFHEPTFRALLEKQYSDNPPNSTGWYAAFMVLLAISCRLRISHTRAADGNPKPVEAYTTEAWSYFENATGVLIELVMRNTDLLTIQALVGMALFLQGTANPQPSFFLISAAVRIATSIGLHRRGNAFGLTPFESQQRRRLFWVLYMLDKDTALRSGRPPCINDDDCSLDLPDENPADGVGTIELTKEKGTMNLFRIMAEFAMIESKCYMQLYSMKASKQSDGELLNTIGQLDHEIEQWKDSIPAEFRPENEISLAHRPPLVMHVVFLHFVYYSTLTTIHRMSVHHGFWSNRLSNYARAGLNSRPLNPRVFTSAALCVAAARATVHLIRYIDVRDYPCTWLVMYYPVSALVTLFANILQNPQDMQARSDLHLMQAVVNFLGTVMDYDKENLVNQDDGSITRMLSVCGEFLRISKLVLDKADKESAGRKKRKSEDQAGPARNGNKAPRPQGASSVNVPEQNHQQQPPAPSSKALAGDEMEMDPQALYSNELGSPFSGDAMNWLNDLDETQSPSSATPPITMENFQNMPMLSANSFEQPFVPQDLWQMPMTFEWDWADVNSMQWDGQAQNPHNHNHHL